ncbi:hypothetical protein AB840_12140 [Megasphaera cerevisiae DSM 20462]|uniref:Uncharacterized protein n=1 Tax=Megasphaera cerevisiae DSM 20462 TaxID=1122219 RepID=A0A0J6ZLE7_9FIRM|nr:hypothetical protein [Megasphaera cerevisiae]KMO85681.1 hypothetical protein AB840_12140 [Megasphaera cerevisiae DSM 20462]SKA11509.1 hypothetical protein SAMN05660900_02468 [Megasphaera cerevisiae DSM 20462]
MIKTCEICGNEFEINSKQKYCPVCKERVVTEYEKILTRQRKKSTECLICGASMENSHSMHACSPKCQKILNALTAEFRKKRYADRRAKKSMPHYRKNGKKMSRLGRHIEEARAMGMQYGEYMGWRYMQKKQENQTMAD